uniref:Uncharacterized protein n=1 Tax=viral metagenome TaxID=1070528 RepID=A0A6C0HRX4_9ZZZZ
MSQIENNEKFLEIIANLESRLEKMDVLEKELKRANERIEWLEMNHEKRIKDLERSDEIRGRIMDSVCNECTTLTDFQIRTESCLNTLFQSLGQIEKRQERAEARNNEYICKLETILDQQETEMLQCEVNDLTSIQQRTESELGLLRLKVIDVFDQVENVTKDVKEVTTIVSKVYFKNKHYDETIRMVMGRMDEHEMAMKTCKANCKANCEIDQKTQKECQFCDSLAEITFDQYDCCVSCMQHNR